MAKLSEVLNTTSIKFGVASDDEDLKKLLSDPRLDIEIPESLSKAFEGELLTVEAAKQNKDVAHHFKGRYNHVLENGLKKTLTSLGAPQDLIDEFDSDKTSDTVTKTGNALKKFHELTKSASTSDDGGKKLQEYAKQVNELQKQLGEKEDYFKSEKEKIFSDFESERINNEINLMMSNYTFSDTLPADDTRFLISRKLGESPYVFKRDEKKKIVVYQKDNPELIAMKNNKPLEPKDVLDEIAAPYLKKNTTTTTTTTKVETGGGAYTYGDNSSRNKDHADHFRKRLQGT